jgi:sulfite exporter TauE/SafE
MECLRNVSDTVKGNVLIVAGTILLLNALGITLKVITILTIVAAVFMILYGFIQAGYYQMIKDKIR